MKNLKDFAKKRWEAEVKQLEQLFAATIELPDYHSVTEEEYGRALRSLQQLDNAKRSRLQVIKELERILDDEVGTRRTQRITANEMTTEQKQMLALVRERLNGKSNPTISE